MENSGSYPSEDAVIIPKEFMSSYANNWKKNKELCNRLQEFYDKYDTDDEYDDEALAEYEQLEREWEDEDVIPTGGSYLANVAGYNRPAANEERDEEYKKWVNWLREHNKNGVFAVEEGTLWLRHFIYDADRCSELSFIKKIYIPETVESLGGLEYLQSLTEVIIPDSVTRICTKAFWNCISLKNINIPDSVTKIRDYAFCGCRSLTSVKIPNGVALIYGNVFEGCDNLKTIYLPTECEIDGGGYFEECPAEIIRY